MKTFWVLILSVMTASAPNALERNGIVRFRGSPPPTKAAAGRGKVLGTEYRMIDGKIQDANRATNWFYLWADVVQSVDGGYLVNGTLRDFSRQVVDGYSDEKQFYLLKNFRGGLVDGVRIHDERVKVVGSTSYTTVLGVSKTIRVLDFGTPVAPPPPPAPTPAQVASDAAIKIAREKEKQFSAAHVLRWQMEQATNGAAHAQCSLGIRYLRGDGVPKDIALARHWLSKAAAQDHPEAQTALSKIPQ